MWADEYELYSGTITEGDYVICYSGKAMKNTISSNRFSYETVSPSNNKITNPSAAIVWHIAASGDYWTIYNASVGQYAGGNGTANKGALISSVTDYAKWTVTGTNTYNFVNYGNNDDRVNAYLRNNGTYGFACYASGTGGALSLYKKKVIVATALSVKTAPTKLNYKKGETLDLTGLVLNATVGGDDVEVTSGYTASPANGATLNSVGAQTVTFTYGGQNTTQTIHVGDLESIALTTTGVKTTYDEGQTFDHTNLVVTATYSDGETTPTTWTEDVDLGDCSFDPDGALATTDDNVEVSYTWGSTTKTADIAITVNAASAYTVTFNAGTGSCATSSLTEASAKAGVTLPTATIGVTGWSFVGWATASTTNTEDEPTLYAAGATYKPSDNCTLYAVYKFTEGTEGDFIRATKLSEVKGASQVILVNGGKTLTTDLSAKDALSESEGVVTAADKTVFTLSGNDTDGYVLSSASGNIGASSLPTTNGNFQDLAITSSNSTWTITTNSTANTFTFLNKGGTNVGLEYYSTGSKWVAYKTSSPTTSSYYSTKVYIPNWATVYNSNPAAIVNPTIAWTTSGDKTLYLQNTNTYDNAANVTGISKTPVYTSSDETVATVTAAGVVTALKKGSTTITAKVSKEVGVNTAASVNYELTVKDASNVAGLKEVATSSSATSFTADLTDAVVTYVNGSYAYIEDASGAIYASCGSSLTAGKKINGAVSGSVKVSYQIDEITAIDLSDATVEDGVIPSAIVQTTAQVIANKATLEGKLVSVTGAKVTASLTNGNASGGKIKTGTDEDINLYAPASNIDASKDAEGTFNGYISLYNGGLRFNIYEQSQISLTKNAPTAQPLVFAEDDVVLDELTNAFNTFTPQAVTGAVGTVTYAITGDAVYSGFSTTDGTFTLNGTCGTATITATAAAKEVTEAGVTTPYTETIKSYTVTVRPRYYVTFSVNGVETTVRQASYGVTIAVPTPDDFGDYKFLGWCESTVDPTDDDTDFEFVSIGATLTPVNNSGKYYAVFAQERTGGEENRTSDFTIKTSSTPASPSIVGGVTWTHGGVSFANSASAGMPNGAHVTFALPSEAIKVVSVEITKTSNDWSAAKVSLPLTDSSDNLLVTLNSTTTSYNFTNSNNNAGPYTITANNTDSKVAYIDKITVTYAVIGTENYDYRTSLPTVELSIGTSGMLAFCYDRALDFSTTDVKAYKAKVEGGVVKLTKVSDGIVPANTGVILAATAETNYEIPVATADATTDFSDNEMVGVTQRTQVLWNPSTDVYNYILQSGEFKKASNGYLKPNRAYLSTSYNVSATSAREYLEISFEDDDVTGVENVNRSTITNNQFYDLQGRKVEQPQKGLYIVNGKKVIIK